MDWNLLDQRHEVAARLLQTVPEFSRALVTSEGTTFMPSGGGEHMFFSDFQCGHDDAMVAHFTASLIDGAGFGHFDALKKTLPDCAEVFVYRKPDGTVHIYTRLA